MSCSSRRDSYQSHKPPSRLIAHSRLRLPSLPPSALRRPSSHFSAPQLIKPTQDLCLRHPGTNGWDPPSTQTHTLTHTHTHTHPLASLNQKAPMSPAHSCAPRTALSLSAAFGHCACTVCSSPAAPTELIELHEAHQAVMCTPRTCRTDFAPPWHSATCIHAQLLSRTRLELHAHQPRHSPRRVSAQGPRRSVRSWTRT